MKLVDIEACFNEELPLISQDQAFMIIGKAAGSCYNSNKLDLDACKRRTLQCIKDGHHSVLEHVNVSVTMIVDRGTSHALVRHRHIAVTQESTLYSKYRQECSFIKLYKEDPITSNVHNVDDNAYQVWYESLYNAEQAYQKLINANLSTTIARDVLPNDTATRLTITTSLREWLWIMQVRSSPADSIRMHVLDNELKQMFNDQYPDIIAAYDIWLHSKITK